MASVLAGLLLTLLVLAQGNQLTAIRVNTLPSGPEDRLWNSLRGVKTTLFGMGELSGKQLELEMKAVHNNQEIALYFRWPDAEASLTKDAWQFGGTNWKRLGGDEDRLSIIFPITSIPAFTAGGCAGMCHSTEKGGYMGTNSANERADLWHWKSYRSNPLGFADDGYVMMKPQNADTGRASDAGGGGDRRNETTDKTKPLYMQDPAKKPSAQGFLVDDEKVEIKDYGIFKAGDVVAYRILTRPSGDRGSIAATGIWKEGYWTLQLRRKLNTESPNDVVFRAGQTIPMGIGVFDNSADGNKYVSPGNWSLRLQQSDPK